MNIWKNHISSEICGWLIFKRTRALIAAALAGDTTKSRKTYQDFFALWKDADANTPILIEAKQEYEKLK